MCGPANLVCLAKAKLKKQQHKLTKKVLMIMWLPENEAQSAKRKHTIEKFSELQRFSCTVPVVHSSAMTNSHKEPHLREATQLTSFKFTTAKHGHACSTHTCSGKLAMNTVILAKIFAKQQPRSKITSLVNTGLSVPTK